MWFCKNDLTFVGGSIAYGVVSAVLRILQEVFQRSDTCLPSSLGGGLLPAKESADRGVARGSRLDSFSTWMRAPWTDAFSSWTIAS